MTALLIVQNGEISLADAPGLGPGLGIEQLPGLEMRPGAVVRVSNGS